MVKYILLIYITTLVLFGQEPPQSLQRDCLACHQLYFIPSEMIYRRYLMKHSSKRIVKEKILDYLGNPLQKNSIMPAQFFLKFKMKERTPLSAEEMNLLVDSYIDEYDVSKKLFSPKKE